MVPAIEQCLKNTSDGAMRGEVGWVLVRFDQDSMMGDVSV